MTALPPPTLSPFCTLEVELGQPLLEVPEPQVPRGVRPAEEGLDVAPGDRGEVLAALDRHQAPADTEGAQEREGQAAGAHARLHHGGAGEDVAHRDDLAGVLGVDDGRAARHRQHVVGEQRAQREVRDARRVLHDDALAGPDEVGVPQVAPVGVERAVGVQRDGVQAPARVGQLDALADPEGAAALGRPGRFGQGGVVGGHGRRV